MSLASQSSHSWQTHTFAEKNGIEIQLDYLPALIQEGVKTPFFFLIHGGAFVSGDRKTWSPWIIGLARMLKIALVSVDYRLCPEATLSESTHDVYDAWKYVTEGRLDPQLDAQRGIAVAISAGGYFLLHAGVSFQPKPFALLDVYGIPAMIGDALEEKNTSLPEAMTTSDPLFEMSGNALREALESKTPVTGSWLDFSTVLGIPKEMWLQVGLKNGFEETEWSEGVKMGKQMTMTDGLRAKMSPYALYNGLIGKVVSGNGREEENHDQAGDAFLDRNPMQRIDDTFPPYCSVHGDSDVFVAYKYKAQLVEHLQSIVKGRQSPKLITVKGGDHMMDLLWDTNTSQVVEVYHWLSDLL